MRSGTTCDARYRAQAKVPLRQGGSGIDGGEENRVEHTGAVAHARTGHSDRSRGTQVVDLDVVHVQVVPVSVEADESELDTWP